MLVDDYTPGVGGLSVPAFDARGVAGVLTVSGPSQRWSLDAMREALPAVLRECSSLLPTDDSEEPSPGEVLNSVRAQWLRAIDSHSASTSGRI